VQSLGDVPSISDEICLNVCTVPLILHRAVRKVSCQSVCSAMGVREPYLLMETHLFVSCEAKEMRVSQDSTKADGHGAAHRCSVSDRR
jgi:hypothetical protein